MRAEAALPNHAISAYNDSIRVPNGQSAPSPTPSRGWQMTITAAQLEARRGWIGASDVPVIVGVSPWKDPFTLWAEETGKVPVAEAGDAAKWGNLLEPVILDCAATAYWEARRQVHRHILTPRSGVCEGQPRRVCRSLPAW